MAKNEIAAQETNTALAIMSDLEQDAGAGFDGMTQEDYALPFLRLLTSTSPEVGEVDGALPGMMLNSVTGELFDGKKGIAVVPCAYVRQYIEWMPRGQGSGAPVHIYPATSDILSQTHKEPGDNKDYLDNGNYIENTANYYVMIISEQGVPGYATTIWLAFFLPAKTPTAIVDKMNQDLRTILQRPDVKERFNKLGMQATNSSTGELDTLLKQELVQWAKVVKDGNIKPE
jgi:hypothetical protein